MNIKIPGAEHPQPVVTSHLFVFCIQQYPRVKETQILLSPSFRNSQYLMEQNTRGMFHLK